MHLIKDRENDSKIADHFIKRMEDLYLNPSKLLNNHAPERAFACGILIFSMWDSISRYVVTCHNENKKNKLRFTTFLKQYSSKHSLNTDDIYNHSRCGLIHEGKIKKTTSFHLIMEIN